MLDKFELLLPKELEKLIQKLQEILKIKEYDKRTVDLVVDKKHSLLYCPECVSVHIKKNGKYKGRQLYKCKDCNKNSTN